jgi:hypothetical protein
MSKIRDSRTKMEITLGEDGLWRNADGVVFAFADKENSMDEKTRCGVGVLSLPETDPATFACSLHDFKYASKGYQHFNSREKADKDFLRDLENSKINLVKRKIMYTIVRIFGRFFWEKNK